MAGAIIAGGNDRIVGLGECWERRSLILVLKCGGQCDSQIESKARMYRFVAVTGKTRRHTGTAAYLYITLTLALLTTTAQAPPLRASPLSHSHQSDLTTRLLQAGYASRPSAAHARIKQGRWQRPTYRSAGGRWLSGSHCGCAVRTPRSRILDVRRAGCPPRERKEESRASVFAASL